MNTSSYVVKYEKNNNNNTDKYSVHIFFFPALRFSLQKFMYHLL